MPHVLGIETSCDETAAAIYGNGKILADCIIRQIVHEEYGGVVPELASRAHEKLLAAAVDEVLRKSRLEINDLDGAAVTYGPGLAGALLVGVAFAKGLAAGAGLKLIGVNHLEAHLWSAELQYSDIPTPFLAYIISGGHTLLVYVAGFREYQVLGSTQDDAVGELFDKTGRMMGINYPAGSSIDAYALKNNSKTVEFPRARVKNDKYGFSFSGLKTAVLYYLKANFKMQGESFDLNESEKESICAGLMASVADMLIRAAELAFTDFEARALVITGGVSASKFLRNRFQKFTENIGAPLFIPSINLCTDNGAMVAYLGDRLYRKGHFSDLSLPVEPSLTLAY